PSGAYDRRQYTAACFGFTTMPKSVGAYRRLSDLLAALNTGHEGGCGTVHANAAADVPARLEALGTAAGLDRAALHSQLAAAVSVVLHLVRDRSGRRRIAEVHVLERDPTGLVRTVPALRWGARAFVEEAGWGRLRELSGVRWGADRAAMANSGESTGERDA
ncbi:ATPase, T2SS/T4P/T4SS family, partial [Streptomyces sp. NPDC018693]|uniref:ATPase, T2SS/T4P/T4SS family n=1 Tax=unclassified Streptomyces TaxID=2593676 RepID=UPI00378F111F